MDAAWLTEQEELLFAEWAAGRPGFIRDGAVDAGRYLASEYKLLYLLKEVNGGSDWDLRDFLREGGRKQTWDNVARWTLGIQNLGRELTWAELDRITQERRREALRSICAVNVKKTSGTFAADSKLVAKAAQEDAAFLKRQIGLYKPDIVICCGTERNYWHDVMKSKPQWKSTARGIWYFREEGGPVVVAFMHPAARAKDCLLYYGLVDAVREIFGIERSLP